MKTKCSNVDKIYFNVRGTIKITWSLRDRWESGKEIGGGGGLREKRRDREIRIENMSGDYLISRNGH